MKIKILYPDKGWIEEDRVLSIANDCFGYHEIPEKPKDLNHAVRLLEDAGHATFAADKNGQLIVK